MRQAPKCVRQYLVAIFGLVRVEFVKELVPGMLGVEKRLELEAKLLELLFGEYANAGAEAERVKGSDVVISKAGKAEIAFTVRSSEQIAHRRFGGMRGRPSSWSVLFYPAAGRGIIPRCSHRESLWSYCSPSPGERCRDFFFSIITESAPPVPPSTPCAG